MNSSEAVIVTRGLTKRFGDNLAVDRVNLEVKQGEIFGLLGPNGAGKTTIIRMLTGLSRPTAGTARVLGFDIEGGITEAKKYIGVVPDSSNLYTELSAMDNLLFMAQLYGIPRRQHRALAEELLKTFRLYERRNARFGSFSRGMKRALTIAAALIHNPRLVFLDEPTAGLDVVAARSLRSLIGDLRQKGTTVFLTTHYLEEADLLCDRIAILVKGRIVETDTPEALKTVAQEESIIELSLTGEVLTMIEELSKEAPQAKTVLYDQNRVRVYGGAPHEIFKRVFEISQRLRIEIQAVNTLKPSLEDAFIKITGLSPTLMAIEKGKKSHGE